MISLIVESSHFSRLFTRNSMQPEITPNSENVPWGGSFLFLQNCTHAALGCLNPFNFSTVSHFGFAHLPAGATSRNLGALKSLSAIGMKHHSLSPTRCQRSRKETFFPHNQRLHFYSTLMFIRTATERKQTGSCRSNCLTLPERWGKPGTGNSRWMHY